MLSCELLSGPREEIDGVVECSETRLVKRNLTEDERVEAERRCGCFGGICSCQ